MLARLSIKLTSNIYPEYQLRNHLHMWSLNKVLIFVQKNKNKVLIMSKKRMYIRLLKSNIKTSTAEVSSN